MKHRKDNQTIYKTFELIKYTTQDRKFIEIFSPATSYIKTIGSNSGKNKIIYILSDNGYSHICLHILQNDILVNRFCLSDTHALITNLDLLFDFSQKYKLLSHNIILL